MKTLEPHWEKVLTALNEAVATDYAEHGEMTTAEYIENDDSVYTWSLDHTLATLFQHLFSQFIKASNDLGIIAEDDIENVGKMCKWFEDYNDESETGYEGKVHDLWLEKSAKGSKLTDEEYRLEREKLDYGLELFKTSFGKLWT